MDDCELPRGCWERVPGLPRRTAGARDRRTIPPASAVWFLSEAGYPFLASVGMADPGGKR